MRLEASKPPTKKNGAKLSIKNFRTITAPDGSKTYRPTFLPELVAQPYRVPSKPCDVCGAKVKASKATGCGPLPEAA